MSVFLVHITSWGSKGPGVNLQEMNESQCNALWSHVCVYMCACAWCLLHCDSTLKLMLCERCGLCACRFLCWRVRLIDRSPLSPSLWKILFIPCFSVMIYTTPPATTHWSEKQRGLSVLPSRHANIWVQMSERHREHWQKRRRWALKDVNFTSLLMTKCYSVIKSLWWEHTHFESQFGSFM